MITGLLAALILLPSDVQRCGPLVLEAAAITGSSPSNVTACVRVMGKLPEDTGWNIRISHITEARGEPTKDERTYGGSYNVAPNTIGVLASASFPNKSPYQVKIDGELTHLQHTDETAVFPPVDLHQVGGRNTHVKDAMRDWLIPDESLVGTKTDRGLGLTYFKPGGRGYSGPGYEDMSWLPVRVVPGTITNGISDLLAQCHAKEVERVEANVDGLPPQIIYQRVSAVEGRTFGFANKQFTQRVTLKLHVQRFVADQRYKFSFVAQVQPNKDFFAEHMGRPDPAKFVVWPSSRTKP